MGARKSIARTSSNYTRVKDKTFHLEDSYKLGGSVQGMRSAAKRFAETAKFNNDALYYEGRKINGRYKFTAIVSG